VQLTRDLVRIALSRNAWLAALLVAAPAGLRAQDTVMSTGTLGSGALEALAYPVWLPGDEELGGLARGAWGLEDGVALRGHAGFFDDLAYFGASAEIRAARVESLELTAVLGVHRSDLDGAADILGFDASLVARHGAPGLSYYGGIDLDFERPEEPFDSFTRSHLVAGLTTELASGIDLVAEGGLGFNDSSPDYLSAGLALRFD